MKNLLAEFLVQPWAMDPKALEALIERVKGLPLEALTKAPLILDTNTVDTKAVDVDGSMVIDLRAHRPPVAFFGDYPPPKRKGMTVEAGVARIPVSGTLLKRVPAWMRWFGFDATAYTDIQEDIRLAAADPSVKEIVLAVSSPGGQVAGVHEAAEAIHAARTSGKKIMAEVEDLCASAAYWLAAQAGRIVAGPNAQVGSIGVYSVYVDSSKAAEDEGFKVHVVSSGPHKGAGVRGSKITAEQLAGFQAVIDGMAENFKAAVSRGRGRARKDSDEWCTGQVWLAGEAARMGLIDQVGKHTREEGAAGVRPAAQIEIPKQEEETMADEKALADERKRVADISAAFPKHPAFANGQILKGASLLEAKAAFNDVLQAEADSANSAKADAEKRLDQAVKAKTTGGADPVATGGDPSRTIAGGKDFMAAAREERAEHVKTCIARMQHKGEGQPECCTMTSAMSRVSAENPELHRKYIEATAPKVSERKVALGWK